MCVITNTKQIISRVLLFTWSVGVFNLGHLWSDEFGGVLLLAAVSLLFLAFLHLFIVVLHNHAREHTHTVRQRKFKLKPN